MVKGTIRSVSSMQDIASSRNKRICGLLRRINVFFFKQKTAYEIKRLAEQTRLAANELKGIGTISNELNSFIQSVGRLANAGGKTGQTASGLKSLATETLEFFNVMSKAPRISENTIRMTQALSQLASAGGRVGTSTNTISKAFNKLASVGDKTLSAMKKVARGIASAFQ